MVRNVNPVNVIARMCEKLNMRFLETTTANFTKFVMFKETDGNRAMFFITVTNKGSVEVSTEDKEIYALYASEWIIEDKVCQTMDAPIPTGCYCSNPDCEYKFPCPTITCRVKRQSYNDNSGNICWEKCTHCFY